MATRRQSTAPSRSSTEARLESKKRGVNKKKAQKASRAKPLSRPAATGVKDAPSRRQSARAVRLPAGSFYPPGYELVEPNAAIDVGSGAGLWTYFVVCNRRRLDKLQKTQGFRVYCSGFRAVIVSKNSDLEPELEGMDHVGKLQGDHFDRGMAWARSNVVSEAHQHYLTQGGGTPSERRATLGVYHKAAAEVRELSKLLEEAEGRLDAASLALVHRFGRGPIEIDGVYWDASYSWERVYWKARLSMYNPERGEREQA